MEMQTVKSDNYVEVFTDGEEIMHAIDMRTQNTHIITLPTKDISIWNGTFNPDTGTVEMVHYDGQRLCNKTIKAQNVTPELAHTAKQDNDYDCGTGLILSYYEGKTCVKIGISGPSKLTLGTRAGVTISGELCDKDLPFSRVALASVYESALKSRSKRVQLITVYGKVIGIMSERFTHIPQAELMDNVHSVLMDTHKDTLVVGGYVSNRVTCVDYDLHETVTIGGHEYELMIKMLNSDNGYSAVRLIPCCRRVYTDSNGKVMHSPVYRFDDDEWACNHVALDMTRISNGADSMFKKLAGEVALLAEAQNYTLKLPYQYAESVINQLNEFAVTKGGTKISKKMTEDILSVIESVASNGGQLTVAEVADILLYNIPTTAATTTKDSMQRTIMRIFALDHSKFDKI
jgi:hypothetical protein